MAGSKPLQRLYQQLSAKNNCGLHASWQSGTTEGLLLKEKRKLEGITGKSICISRNHYLRMKLPTTYRKLIAAGIHDDYSMAYGSINGFRASYTLPYRWYDLEN